MELTIPGRIAFIVLLFSLFVVTMSRLLTCVAVAAVGVLIGRSMLYIDGVLSLRQYSV